MHGDACTAMHARRCMHGDAEGRKSYHVDLAKQNPVKFRRGAEISENQMNSSMRKCVSSSGM